MERPAEETPPGPKASEVVYDAFISYSHRGDAEYSEVIHRAIGAILGLAVLLATSLAATYVAIDRQRAVASQMQATWVNESVALARQAQALAFIPTGERLAVGLSDGSVRVFDSATGGLPLDLSANARKIRSVEFSDDGELLMAAGDDHTARLWPVGANVAAMIRRAEETFAHAHRAIAWLGGEAYRADSFAKLVYPDGKPFGG